MFVFKIQGAADEDSEYSQKGAQGGEQQGLTSITTRQKNKKAGQERVGWEDEDEEEGEWEKIEIVVPKEILNDQLSHQA